MNGSCLRYISGTSYNFRPSSTISSSIGLPCKLPVQRAGKFELPSRAGNGPADRRVVQAPDVDVSRISSERGFPKGRQKERLRIKQWAALEQQIDPSGALGAQTNSHPQIVFSSRGVIWEFEFKFLSARSLTSAAGQGTGLDGARPN